MSQINRLMSSFNSRAVYGSEDKDEALHNAIEAVYPLVSDDRKAKLYSILVERWDEYPHGVQRRIYIKSCIQRWDYEHLYPPALVTKEKMK